MTKFCMLALGLIFSVSGRADNFTLQSNVTNLKFFNGQVVATLTWLKQPTVSQKNQLKIELKEANGQALEVDPSELNANLYMTEMPDMGTEKQKVVAIADASGNPVAGSFMINGMRLSMGGGWTLTLTLPNPDGHGQTETQKFEFSTN